MAIDLGTFDGLPVLGIRMKIRNTGDGLSKAMEVEPRLLHQRQTVHVVLECEVVDVQHPIVKDTDGVHRVHVLRAGTATIIDSDVVSAAVGDMKERVRLHQEAKEGVRRLPTGDELLRQHEAGEHANGLVTGCPACDAEVAATVEERKRKR